MTKLTSALAAATLATTLLAGCETNPSKPTDNGPNAPRALSATTAKPSEDAAPKVIPPAVLKWNVDSCNKDGLTENKLNTSEVCVRIIESGVPISQTTGQSSSRPSLKAAMPGTKNAAGTKSAPTATANQPSSTAPAPTAYALMVTLSECGATNTAAGILESAGGLFGGITDKLGAAAKAAANRAAGGGIAGRAASEATTTVTGSTTQRGHAVANDTQKTLTEGCKIQTTNFINDAFKPAIGGLSKTFSEAHPGYKAVYNVTSELPAVYNSALQTAAGQTAPTRAPSRQ